MSPSTYSIRRTCENGISQMTQGSSNRYPRRLPAQDTEAKSGRGRGEKKACSRLVRANAGAVGGGLDR